MSQIPQAGKTPSELALRIANAVADLFTSGFVDDGMLAGIAAAADKQLEIAPANDDNLLTIAYLSGFHEGKRAATGTTTALIDYENLRYIQRVLESDAPQQDCARAAAMVREARRQFHAQPADSAAVDAEMRADELLELIEQYGKECATKAYHGEFHCRQSPESLLERIRSALAAHQPPAQPELTEVPGRNDSLKTGAVWEAFNATYDELCQRPMSNREIAWRCVRAALAASAQRGESQDAINRKLEEVAASFVHSFRPEDRLSPEYIGDCILSHIRAAAPTATDGGKA